MSVFFWNCVAKTWLALLSLRYKIRIKGGDAIREAGEKGILFLPNHPAHIDPLFLFLLLWPKHRMRPIVVEYIFRLSILKPFMRLIRAIPIPNFDTSINQFKVKKAEDAIREIADGLEKGENFILYPAGRLKNSGREVIGGASGTHALLQERPNTPIVLIRTTGLWGSSFSRALQGKAPHLPEILVHGVKTVLCNGLFFVPRRLVEIELKCAPNDLPRSGSRLDLNRYLENWYNQYPDNGKVADTEPLHLVSYKFWTRDVPIAFQKEKKKFAKGEVEIRDETHEKIYTEIRRIVNNPGIEIKPEMSLATDLGMDSLNIADLMVFIAKNYNIDTVHPEDLESVQSVLEAAEGVRLSEDAFEEKKSFYWLTEKGRPGCALPTGKTFPEAFLYSCERMGHFAACADDTVGVLSYKKMKQACIVLSLYFKKIPETNIAVLLPASVGAYLVILALEFAGKVPVMLNWTLGPKNLEEMMEETGAKTVISSWRFLDRLSHVDFGNLVDKIFLLEEIREKLSIFMKLRGVLISHYPVRFALRSLGINQMDEHATAVILYTSGTEAKPKGVPLSHKNILSNQRSAMQCIELHSNDILYGVLPPFHSFGFSVIGLFPLFGGIKVAFYPDPTDGFALAEGIERWKITLFCSPPSFLKGLLNSARVEQLKTVRWFISGAEKAPPELFERIEGLGSGARMIEGYGITECSPVLTLTRANLPLKGVGQLLPDIEICTIHVESQELLPAGSEGEFCVRGPNVFDGYLGSPRDPFIEIEGKRWYRTGDIGYLDEEGNLIISGRIKRFTKVGGEMISLGGVEENLVKSLIEQGRISSDIPSLAVVADEKKEGQPQLILFSTVSIRKDEVNDILRSRGFSRLVKISSVKKIDEIPLMGTGKTDYRALQNTLDHRPL
ncbi:MAG TPA: AMP-binding protein [Chlamydiales bacterium]|nr:AMP-binding protein [Chlamydiales bacterium]